MDGDGIALRPWKDDDVEWWVGLFLAWQPDFPADQMRARALGQLGRYRRRLVAQVDGTPAGYAGIVERVEGEVEAYALVLVDPAYRGRGIGSLLFRAVSPEFGTTPIARPIPDDAPRSLAIAVRRRIDLAQGATPPELPVGVRIEVVRDSELDTCDIDVAGLLDATDTSPERQELGWDMNLAYFRLTFPGSVWVVLHVDDEPVALSGAFPHDGDWVALYTGVRQQFRRRGLGRLVKLHLHALAASEGATGVVCHNEDMNVPCTRLNESLGYVRVSGELRLVRIATASPRDRP